MTAAASPSLLARDREQLDRVIRFLKGERRGFFALVCRPELREAAVEYLAEQGEKAIPGAVMVTDHDSAAAALQAIDGAPKEAVSSMVVEGASIDVWTALNWHREKLRRGGQVLLWLDSAERLQDLSEHAPDAYSFREGVIVLEGEEERSPEPDGEEPPRVAIARLLFKLPRSPEERAQAAVELMEALQDRGKPEEALHSGKDALALLPGERFDASHHRTLRAEIYGSMAGSSGILSRGIDAYRYCRRALEELREETSEDAMEKRASITIFGSLISPLSADPEDVRRALRAIPAQPGGLVEDAIRAVAARDAQERGRFARSLKLYVQCLGRLQMPLPRAHLLLQRTAMHLLMGDFALAREDAAEAREAFRRASYPLVSVDELEAGLWIDRGEFAVAERSIRAAAEIHLKNSVTPMSASFLASVRLQRGEVQEALRASSEGIREVVAASRDIVAFTECSHLVSFLAEAKDAAAISAQIISEGFDIIDSCGRVLVERAAGDPPWYRVLFPELRARVLVLLDSRQEEAFAQARESIVLARSLWKHALVPTTRTLVRCLARAGRWSDMEPAISDALQSARDEDHLRALATIQAHDLARLAILGAPDTAVDKALADLRTTFSEMAAPRVEAETWLEIEPYLPPLAARPNALEIADRAHSLFLDMPMPAPAARCMEWLGDIHAARGERSRAEACYRMSIGTIDRYGLLLRKPLVQRKLARLAEAA